MENQRTPLGTGRDWQLEEHKCYFITVYVLISAIAKVLKTGPHVACGRKTT